MPIAVDEIVRIKLFLKDARAAAAELLNVFHYRCSAGTMSEENFGLIADQFESTTWARIKDALPNSVSAIGLRIAAIRANPGYEHVHNTTTWDPGELDFAGHAPIQAAACFTMRNYFPGRKAVGRKYIGPLGAGNMSDGLVLQNPGGTGGNLIAVRDALQDPIVSGSLTLKPCIWNPGSGVSPSELSKCDVRVITIAPFVSFLKSRRPDQGS